MALFVALSVMWGLTLALAVIAMRARSSRTTVLDRLGEAMGQVGTAEPAVAADEADDLPLTDRVVRPALRWVAHRFERLLRVVEGTEELLRSAGTPLRMNVTEYQGLKVVCAAALLAAMAALALVFPILHAASPALVLAGPMLGMTLPAFVMKRLAASRRCEMQLTLPDVLDLITLSVEAGMGFDGAVARAAAATAGPLGDELTRTLDEIGQGRSRADAFRALAERAKVEEISLLVSTVHQAEQLGVSIGPALRDLGGQLREERVHRARELIAKLPVKMLFPLIVFIFPSLFIVILGPSVIMIKGSSLFGMP